ncbi:hypothetical protein Tco_0787284 [Tanacetum coccineum]
MWIRGLTPHNWFYGKFVVVTTNTKRLWMWIRGKKNYNYKEFMPSSSPRPLTPSSSFLKPSTPPSSSHGPSRYASSLGNEECSNCKLLALKTKILDARLDMERHPDNHMSISWNTS